jgi:hypothetical protein
MDFVGLATIGTAIGTIVLAIATFFLAYFTYKSIKTSEKIALDTKLQTKIILSQQQPHLSAEIIDLTNESINIKLINHGPGPAYDIGVECYFFPTEFITRNSNSPSDFNLNISEKERSFFKGFTDDEIKKTLLKMKAIGRYNPIVSPQMYDERFLKKSHLSIISSIVKKFKPNYFYQQLFPAPSVVFLKDDKKHAIWLNSLDDGNYSINLFFGLSNIAHWKFPLDQPAFGYCFQAFNFSEIKTILQKNRIYSIGIVLTIVSRNVLQKARSHQTIASFIIDFRTQKSLKEALDRNISAPTTLSWNDATTLSEVVPSVLYQNLEWEE